MSAPEVPRRPRDGSRSTRAIRLRPRATLAVLLATSIGLAAFAWPLFVDPGLASANLRDAPLLFTLLLPLVLMVVLSEIADGGIDAKAVAMLGVLTAVGAALRPLGTGVAGFEPVFFLLVLAGRVHGAGFGFVLGATTLFASALTTGGVGPWLPFQMLGAAWVGAGAGLLPPLRGRAELAMLAVYSLLAGLFYGLMLNLSFWPFALPETTAISFVPGDPVGDNLRRFVAFTLATSMGFDVPRALVTAGLVLLTGRPLLRALRRAARKAAFDAPVVFADDVGSSDDEPRAPSGR
ncbi:ECF transporter S component [Egicoccus halophilus]|uniref:ABC transporter permease n=1 Tax=Egicoccus halophilus TaxID=1670830 RepID=A0A8J3EZ41_9ACTN|nr:ECF transporter S component [Egicoccus halophilus]GGI09135.1 ABC transporter permease [Egicoccus halophilus]